MLISSFTNNLVCVFLFYFYKLSLFFRPQPKHDNSLLHTTKAKAVLLQNHESGTKDKEVLHQRACPVRFFQNSL